MCLTSYIPASDSTVFVMVRVVLSGLNRNRPPIEMGSPSKYQVRDPKYCVTAISVTFTLKIMDCGGENCMIWLRFDAIRPGYVMGAFK